MFFSKKETLFHNDEIFFYFLIVPKEFVFKEVISSNLHEKTNKKSDDIFISSKKKYGITKVNTKENYEFYLPSNFFFLLEIKHDKIVKYSYNLKTNFLKNIEKELKLYKKFIIL